MSRQDQPNDSGIRRFPLDHPELEQHAAVAPWAEAVEVPSSSRFLFLSGFVASCAHHDADPESVAAYGDMEQQTRSVLSRIKRALQSKGYDLAGLVKMVVFFKDVPEGIDLEGFGRGYGEFFPHDAPLPARSRVVVKRLLNPGWLLEIESVAARQEP